MWLSDLNPERRRRSLVVLMRVFLLFSGLVQVRVGVGTIVVLVVVVVLDVLVLMGRVGMRVDLIGVVVLVLMGRFVRVLCHFRSSLFG